MKSVMLSIQPKWCELIASGKKTIEVRKTRPKLETPFKCYIYCTKATQTQSNNGFWWYADELCFDKNGRIRYGATTPELWPVVRMNGKVIGEFVCNRIENFRAESIVFTSEIRQKSCISVSDLVNYGNGNHLFAWYISKLKIYDKPKELREFDRYSEDYDRPCEKGEVCEYEYFDYSENCKACKIDFDGENCPKMKLQCPPQSWCYVEELEEQKND